MTSTEVRQPHASRPLTLRSHPPLVVKRLKAAMVAAPGYLQVQVLMLVLVQPINARSCEPAQTPRHVLVCGFYCPFSRSARK